MTDAWTLRLSLLLALVGAVLMIVVVSGSMRLQHLDYGLPRFEVSQPGLVDWPDYRPRPVG